MPPRLKPLLTGLALLACAALLLTAYRWYAATYLRPFDTRAEAFSGDGLALPAALAGPGPIRLVHFWDPACPCNVGNQQHLAELLQRYDERQVVFYVVQKPGSRGRLPEPLRRLRPLEAIPGMDRLPASPAAAIWDGRGELVYLGPYSEGAVCSSENSFIEPILDALLDGRPVRSTQTLAAACFCDWTAR